MEFLRQRKRLVNKIIILVILINYLQIPIYSKNGHGKKFGDDCHCLDMQKVLGFYSETDISTSYQNYTKLVTMFDSINNLIDQNITKEFYNELKENFKYFNYGEYGHRIIYHWAFDIDKDISDRQFQDALAKLFNAKISAPYQTYPEYISIYEKIYKKPLTDEIWQSEWSRFKSFIRENQEKQNNELINIVHKYLGLYNSDSRDIAAILYYVHLLGDHVEHSGELTGFSVLEIDDILKNVDIHVKNLSKTNKGLYSLYRNAINSLVELDEKSYAKDILNTMSTYIPQIIKIRFSNELVKKNLIFLFEESLSNVS